MRYHRNATTNINQRQFIQLAADSTAKELASQLCVSIKTVNKWRQRKGVNDRSSRPATITYSLHDEEQRLVVWLRQHQLMLDDIWQGLQDHLPYVNRSNVYRTLKRHGLGRLQKDMPHTKEFAEYDPGYIHMDWFYLPRLEPHKRYCIIAIDRATRWLSIGFYDSMSKANAMDFLQRLVNELPFHITTILTDNGACFTNRWYAKSRGGARGSADFSDFCASFGIEHRLTKARHPWTNGLAENTVKQIKANSTKRHEFSSYTQAEACIEAYVLYHNYQKQHRGLGWQTSYAAALMWYERKPDIFRIDPTVGLRPNENNVVKLTN